MAAATPMATSASQVLLLLVFTFTVTLSSASAGCLPSCPLVPFELCDFFFEGHPLDIPPLQIGGPVNGDTAISPGIISGKTKGKPIEVDQSGPGKLECKDKWNPFTPSSISGEDLWSTGSQFYATGEPGKVYCRTFQPSPGVDAFAGRCVLLPLLNLVVPATDSSPLVNLSPGDGNKDYPEERRCVVFKTWKA